MRILRFIAPLVLAGSAFASEAVDSSVCHAVGQKEAELLKLVRSWHLDFVTTLTGESVPVFVPPRNSVDDKVVFQDEALVSVGSMLVLDQIQAEITAVLDRHLEATNVAYRDLKAKILAARTPEESGLLRLTRDAHIFKARRDCRAAANMGAR